MGNPNEPQKVDEPTAEVDLDSIDVDAAEETSVELETQLTRRQQFFVREYIVDLNATQAAIRAGYSVANAGHKLLTKPHIKLAIERALAARRSAIDIREEKVLQELTILANSNVEDYIITDDGYLAPAPGADPSVMRAVQWVKREKIVTVGKGDDPETTIRYKVEFKLWDKPGSLKLQGRHIGLFPDKVELSGPGGKPIEAAVTVVRRVIVDPKEPT